MSIFKMTQTVKRNIHFDSALIHERLRAIREDRLRLDQRTFASLVGISQPVLSKWERGKYRPPPLALMKIGDISVEDRQWWYEQAGAKFAARLKAEGKPPARRERTEDLSALDHKLLADVMETFDRELKRRKQHIPIRKLAELVAALYEHCKEEGRCDESMAKTLLKIA
jgi:transcriptional regulator with XRE-family HTH domain